MKVAKTSTVLSVKKLVQLVAEHHDEQFVTVTHDDLCSWLDEIERLMTLCSSSHS